MADKQSRRVQVVVPSKTQIRYVFPDTKPNIFNIRNTSSESTVYFKMSGIASNTKYDNVLYPNGTIVSGDVVPMTEVSFYNDGLVEANIILASQYDENATLADFGAKNVQIINQKENPISINADGFIRGISLPYIYEGEESPWLHSIPVNIQGGGVSNQVDISNSNYNGVIVRGVKYGTPYQGGDTDEEFSPFIPVDLRKSQLPDSNPIPVKVVGGSTGGGGSTSKVYEKTFCDIYEVLSSTTTPVEKIIYQQYRKNAELVLENVSNEATGVMTVQIFFMETSSYEGSRTFNLRQNKIITLKGSNFTRLKYNAESGTNAKMMVTHSYDKEVV